MDRAHWTNIDVYQGSQAPFEVPGFKSFRKDRSAHGGGLLAYVRADLPSRRRPDLETETIESIVIETTVCDRKWAMLCCYRSPSLSDTILQMMLPCVWISCMYISITSSLLVI